jgi:hypothetical protein
MAHAETDPDRGVSAIRALLSIWRTGKARCRWNLKRIQHCGSNGRGQYRSTTRSQRCSWKQSRVIRLNRETATKMVMEAALCTCFEFIDLTATFAGSPRPGDDRAPAAHCRLCKQDVRKKRARGLSEASERDFRTSEGAGPPVGWNDLPLGLPRAEGQISWRS